MTDYDHAFGFWRLLAESYVPLGQGKALVNTRAPFVLANALWYPDADTVAEASSFYAEQGVLASVVLEAPNGGLHAALKDAGFVRSARHALRPPESMTDTLGTETAPNTNLVTEQVSWAQTRALGEVMAAVYDLPSYAVAVGQSLALALQLDAKMAAFIAYEAGPVGAMVTLETRDTLTAFMLEAPTDEAKGALEARLTFEAETREKRAYVVSQSEVTNALEVWSQPCSS